MEVIVANRKKNKLRVIPLGGLEEIGKNMTVFEYGESIIVVDCGVAFPEDEMLGIDLVIPDVTYLEKNLSKVKGIIVTHGHEDHIGALPYVLNRIPVPVYGTDLTLALIENKLVEHQMLNRAELRAVRAGQTIQLGAFKVEFIRSTHSIADSVALAIHTPVGVVLHTSDFKIDHTPIEGEPIDLARIAELGKKGVLLLMADSTNVERPGYTMSERTVGETLDNVFKDAKSRIIVATFASNIHRIQQIVNSAMKFNRKVALNGRSMINVVKTAMKLGYLNIPPDVLIDIDRIQKLPRNQIVMITTGSQGEPMSALSRIASNSHRKVSIEKGDLVIISASPIPGNEKYISRVINDLFKQGANVIYEALVEVHVSGHARQEELKLIHRLVRPKFFMPVHGEYRHLKQHANLAQSLGMPEENIFIMENGQVLELSQRKAQIAGTVQAGSILIDGLGVGDVGNIVLRDRKHLSEDGLIVVVVTVNSDGKILTTPEVISRGFVYVKESEELMDEIRELTLEIIQKNLGKRKSSYANIKNNVKDELSSYLYQKTKRKPMILPVIIEIPC
ncbi:ribonuclease J [Thermoclostridium stercorarium subsp. thermolacticum DSM 2910]|jgi:ribonuclease J|uniref:Ribonuclease J n=1 Tax=Thermoclostridium stercorarium subsp. thermolacticum DSM 2910 TaxID=1121336 RepID=A0A1B1YDW9_THEST|nr:ribonuclease J [Thermoclostridium stercorarium subsp. thermolacticum DSM 2910]